MTITGNKKTEVIFPSFKPSTFKRLKHGWLPVWMSDLFRTVQVEETNWRDKKVLGVNPNWRKQLVTFKSVLTWKIWKTVDSPFGCRTYTALSNLLHRQAASKLVPKLLTHEKLKRLEIQDKVFSWCSCCLLRIDKVRAKDKTCIWLSVWWKTKN